MQLECRDAELQSLKSELKERDHRLAASTKRCEELESEVEKEREARVTAVQKFSNEVHHGSSVVSNLEKSLESCQGKRGIIRGWSDGGVGRVMEEWAE